MIRAMNRIERIKRLIHTQFTIIDLDIIDDSQKHAGHQGHSGGEFTHLTIQCQAAEFSTLSKVQSQRQLNTLLKDEFDSGLHAVSYRLS